MIIIKSDNINGIKYCNINTVLYPVIFNNVLYFGKNNWSKNLASLTIYPTEKEDEREINRLFLTSQVIQVK